MYYVYATPREVNDLKFSVWDKNAEYGHTIFVGNLVEIFHFLESNDIKNLQISALDLLAMQSYEPVAAEQWLDWYYSSALSALEENYFDEVLSELSVQQAVKSFYIPGFSDLVIIGMN